MTEIDKQAALFAAIVAAAAECEWVEKRRVQGVTYAYATAESIVAEADRVFVKHGLAIVPGPCQVEQRSYEKDKAVRTVLVLTREFIVVHRDGGSITAGGVAAIGANVGGTPPQAMNSAETMCFAYFVKTLLRMPRQDEEDADHPKSRSAAREEEPREPARPALPVHSTSGLDAKLPMVLDQVARIATAEHYERARAGFMRATETRGMPEGDGVDMCGYSDAGFAKVKAAFADAAKKVGVQ